MADIISEIKKHGSYATKSEEENDQAADLNEAGLINIENGGTITEDEETITVIICSPTKKFDDLVKKKII